MSEEMNENIEGCSHDCSSCSFGNCDQRQAPQKYSQNAKSNIKKVIAVVSGKGGVGKSAVTSLLACKLRSLGKNVAVLDADITGPSIPKAFGLRAKPVVDENLIVPPQSKNGIKLMSLNLLLDNEEDPVAWRGPVVTGVVRQFFEEVKWGDVDVMLIDMPPGTSGVFLTIMQMMPVDGIISVTTPQELVSMIVGKAVNLASEMNVDILALIENMSYFKCDECGKEHHIFGKSHIDEVAQKYGIKTTAFLPIDPEFTKLVDAGRVEDYDVANKLDGVVKVC